MTRIFAALLSLVVVGVSLSADAGCLPTKCAALFGAKKAVTPSGPCAAGALDFSNSCNLVYMETMLR